MNRVTLFMAGIALPGALMAQGIDPETGLIQDRWPVDNWSDMAAGGGRLFFALVAGILLAFACQWVLGYLSAAAGLTAAGKATKRMQRRSYYPEDRYRHEDPYGRERERHYEGFHEEHSRKSPEERLDEEKEWEKPAKKIQTGIGLWVLITVSISSFFAAWAAAELIRFGGRTEAVLLGLTVWSGFMFGSMYLESKVLGSLMGNLLGAFKSGLQAAAAPFKSAAGAMAQKASSSAEEIAAKVREEFQSQGGGQGLKDKLKEFTSSMPSRALDKASIGQEADELFDDGEIREAARQGSLDRRRFQEIAAGRQDLSPEEQRAISDTLHDKWNRIASENHNGGSWTAAPKEQTAQTAGASAAASSSLEGISEMRVETGTATPAADTGLHRVEASGSTFSSGPYASSSQSRSPYGNTPARLAGSPAFPARFQAFKEFLQTSDKHELNPMRLEREVESIVIHPEDGAAGMERNIREMNRNEMAQALRQRRDLTLEEADSIADLIDATRTRMLSRSEIREHRTQEVTDKALARLRDWAYSLKRPELDMDGFKSDFSRLLEDPKGALGSMKDRASESMDRETLINTFAAKKGISRQEAEKMADQAEEAMKKAKENAQKIEAETRRRLESAKRASLEQAEATRRLAASAAWWLFAVACVSAIAACLGGLTGAAT